MQKKTKRVFFSCDLPENRDDADFASIREAVSAFGTVCAQSGVAFETFDDQPAVSNMLRFRFEEDVPDLLRQCVIWECGYAPDESGKAKPLPDGGRNEVLGRDFDAAFFVCGNRRSAEDAEAFRATHPNAPMFAVENTDGAAAELAKSEDLKFSEFRGSFAYVFNFRKAFEEAGLEKE